MQWELIACHSVNKCSMTYIQERFVLFLELGDWFHIFLWDSPFILKNKLRASWHYGSLFTETSLGSIGLKCSLTMQLFIKTNWWRKKRVNLFNACFLLQLHSLFFVYWLFAFNGFTLFGPYTETIKLIRVAFCSWC